MAKSKHPELTLLAYAALEAIRKAEAEKAKPPENTESEVKNYESLHPEGSGELLAGRPRLCR